MPRRWMLILGLVLLTPTLTGCLGMGDEGSDGSDGLETKSRAEVSQEAGGLEGLVTDEAIQPIGEAEVTLEEVGRSTTTADDGSFAFSKVVPGEYTLNITAEGFIPVERTVEISADRISTVEVVLAHQPTVTPYSQQWEFSGFMECSWGAGGGIFIASWNMCNAAGNATSTQATFFHEIQPNAWQVVTEVTWEPNTPASDRFWLAEEPRGFNSAWKVAYASERGTSPIVSHTTRAELTGIVKNFTAICNGEEDPATTSNHFNNPDAYCNHNPIEKGGEVDITVLTQTASQVTVQPPDVGPISPFPVGAGAAVQQEFTVFQTVFYNAPACEDFSVIEDNQCAQLDTPPEDDPYAEISGANATSNNSTAR